MGIDKQVRGAQARLAAVAAEKRAGQMALEEARVTLDAKSQMVGQLQEEAGNQEAHDVSSQKSKGRISAFKGLKVSLGLLNTCTCTGPTAASGRRPNTMSLTHIRL